jgi:hypothetical protein
MRCCLQVARFTQGLALLLCAFTKYGRSLLKAWHLQQMGSSEAVCSCMLVMRSCCKRNCCCCAGGPFYINHAQDESCQASTQGTSHVGMCHTCCMAQRSLQHWARLHARVSVVCAEQPCQPAVCQRTAGGRGVQLSCTRQHVLTAHTCDCCILLHCICSLRPASLFNVCCNTMWQWWHRQQKQPAC